jgi:hypothetical protein
MAFTGNYLQTPRVSTFLKGFEITKEVLREIELQLQKFYGLSNSEVEIFDKLFSSFT